MNKSEIAKQLLGFMRAHKNQFVLSILLAILGVASGMIPYFAIARIMLYLHSNLFQCIKCCRM